MGVQAHGLWQEMGLDMWRCVFNVEALAEQLSQDSFGLGLTHSVRSVHWCFHPS